MTETTTPRQNDRRQARFHTYLLRLWCEEQSESGCWRASLENSHTGERFGFASLEELFAFLMEAVEAN